MSLYGNTVRAEARAGLVYGPYLTATKVPTITTAVGGACTKLRRPYVRPRPNTPKPKRGKVLEFSRRSRTRMQQTLCAIPKDHVISGMLFVTLTYPDEWSRDARVWKRDLDKFGKRLQRKYPQAAAVWKLEPQPKRKAPHYHLIITALKYIDRTWLSLAWYQVVKSGDEKHLRAGTQVQRVMDHRGVISYAAKYTAKRQELPPDWHEPGRWWGVIARENLGIVWKWAPLNQRAYFQAVRVLRSLIARRNLGRSRGPPRPAPAGMWAVLPDWQALRIALCVRDTADIAVEAERHGCTSERTVGVDYRFRRPLAGEPSELSVHVSAHSSLLGAP